MKVKHIGVTYALCSKKHSGSFREDLGSERYKQLGVGERFKNEEPYRICKVCIAIIEARENSLPKTEIKI